MLFRRTKCELQLANCDAAFDHIAASVESPILVRGKPLLHRCGAGQFFGQHDPAFHRHACAGGEVRGRGMHGIAQQDDTPVVPGPRLQGSDKGTIVDPVFNTSP